MLFAIIKTIYYFEIDTSNQTNNAIRLIAIKIFQLKANNI